MVKEDYRIRLSYTLREVARYERGQMGELARLWSGSLRGYIRDVSDWMI